MSLEISASESGEKYVNEFMFAGKMCLTDCGVENCAVRFVIVLMKNVPKSSAVRIDEGGGGGGQRREQFRLGDDKGVNFQLLEVSRPVPLPVKRGVWEKEKLLESAAGVALFQVSVRAMRFSLE